jgi:hypothetical protein
MALDLLSIPAMSADTARLFSAGKFLLTDNSSQLSRTTIEAFLCLRPWDQNSLVINIILASLPPLEKSPLIPSIWQLPSLSTEPTTPSTLNTLNT